MTRKWAKSRMHYNHKSLIAMKGYLISLRKTMIISINWLITKTKHKIVICFCDGFKSEWNWLYDYNDTNLVKMKPLGWVHSSCLCKTCYLNVIRSIRGHISVLEWVETTTSLYFLLKGHLTFLKKAPWPILRIESSLHGLFNPGCYT